MKLLFTLMLLSSAGFLFAQDFSHLTGQTKLINPSGRTLLLEKDNDDSWLTFHDPGNSWYSMGIDRSDGAKFKLNYGSALAETNQFTQTTDGKIGIGTNDPLDLLHVNGSYMGRGHFMLYAYEGEGSSGTAYLQARDRSGTSSINL